MVVISSRNSKRSCMGSCSVLRAFWHAEFGLSLSLLSSKRPVFTRVNPLASLNQSVNPLIFHAFIALWSLSRHYRPITTLIDPLAFFYMKHVSQDISHAQALPPLASPYRYIRNLKVRFQIHLYIVYEQTVQIKPNVYNLPLIPAWNTQC